MSEEAERRWSIFPPSLSGERCTGGAGVDSDRTIALGIRCSGTAPVDIKTKAPAIWIFRGSITRLLCSLHTLDAAISDDSPMLASGRLSPFPAGLQVPLGSCKEFPHLIMNCALVLYVGSDINHNAYRCSCSAYRSADDFHSRRLGLIPVAK